MAKHHNNTHPVVVICVAELGDDGKKIKHYKTDEQIDHVRRLAIEKTREEELKDETTWRGHGKAVQGRFGSMGLGQDRRRRM